MTKTRESLTQELQSYELRMRAKLIVMRKLGLFAAASVLVQIILGGWLSAIRIKPLCPEWPTCFGRLIPPLSAGDLPAGIDPLQFDMQVAWLEFILRLTGALILGLLGYICYYAIRYLHHVSAIFFSSFGVLALMIFEGWIGVQFNAFPSQPVIVSIHTVLAFLMLSVILYLTYHAFIESMPAMRLTIRQPVLLRRWLSAVWILSIFQVIMGCEVRQHFIRLTEIFPNLSGAEVMMRMTSTVYLHGALGIFMAFFTAYVSYQIIKLNGSIPFLRFAAQSLAVINFIMLIVGLSLMAFGIPAVARVLHMLFSALFIGNLVIIYLALKPRFFKA